MEKWRKKQLESFTRVEQLIEFLDLDDKNATRILTNPKFPLLVPRRLAEKMAKNTLDDPIARQFLPLIDETMEKEGFGPNPVGDLEARQCDKLIHKYRGRLLLLPCSSCAMHCRYCFRREFPYSRGMMRLTKELQYIAKDESLHEVILSGGDPLSMSDERLGELLKDIDKIPHIQNIRFHSRFLVGIPERITPQLIEIFHNLRCQIIFVAHVNHSMELDADVFAAFKRLQKAEIPILVQSVLLRGVNDSVKALKDLYLRLIAKGVLPYYLHQLDCITGSSHHEVSEEEGTALIEALRKEVPGYAVPRYVREDAKAPSKTPLVVLN